MAGLSDAVRAYRYECVSKFMGAHGYDGLAFTGSDWFEWLSGYALKDQFFERPYLLIITADGRSFAVVSDLARYGMAV